jgi:deoxyribodipyrimidine photo-lyase
MWFRRDLRLGDNPALNHAVQTAQQVIAIYIHDPEAETPWSPGAASRWWLHHSLNKLDESLRAIDGKLLIKRGNSLSILQQLIAETGASLVTWNRLYEPATIARDSQIKKSLREEGVEVHSDNSTLLFEPWTIQTKQQTPFKVFTPFWRACQLQLAQLPSPLPAPASVTSSTSMIKSMLIDELELLPSINWYSGFEQRWIPGEQAALQQLQHFIHKPVDNYSEQRDRPAILGTSSLSPHLHFGEISPRQIVTATLMAELSGAARQSADVFIKEVGWREFAYHLLYHFPHTTEQPLDARFNYFPWQENKKLLKAWQRGNTGVPLVDAGMRELWHMGWMHNRVRMIVASFLTKNLRMHWLHGARWFWDTLVDADLASNTLGWQWTAGCGADAAPYFRVFNPVLQSERFDPDATYIRKWVPEIAALSNKWIVSPWTAPEAELTRAGITLGKQYPLPVVDLASSREAALEAYSTIKAVEKS